MSVSLSKGGNVSLTKAAPGLTSVVVGLGWDLRTTTGADFDLDSSALLLDAGGKVPTDQHFVFFNNLKSPDGSVEHLGDNTTGSGEGDDETITVDLAQVHRQIDTIFLLVTSYQGQSLEWVANAYCRVVDEQDTELARITLTLGVPETGVVMARIARDGDGWRLRAVAEGIAVKLPTESGLKLKRFL